MKSLTYLAIADPEGSVNGAIGVVAGLISTVPSTNGAKPARNLHKKMKQFYVNILLFSFAC